MISSNPFLNDTLPHHERLLWQAYWQDQDCSRYRDQLIIHYSPFARRLSMTIAVRFQSLGVCREDCHQNGQIGLIEAIVRYRPGAANFQTYSAYRIRGAVFNGLKAYNERLGLLTKTRKERAESILEGYSDQDNSFKKAVDVTLDLVFSALLEEFDEEDLPEANSPYPSQEYYALSQQLFDIAMSLPEKESNIIFQHYFLDCSFVEIAKLLKLSTARVSQLHRRALSFIRERYGQVSGFELRA